MAVPLTQSSSEVYDDGKQRWIDVVAKQYGKNNRGISNRAMKRAEI